uniref:Protein kinase domain-containing protein n=1 Tax=Panagrolaimus sp. JU765 TaxID=591449 RepID=A0AC34R1J7_9BILA
MNFLPEKLDADSARNIRNSIVNALKLSITPVSLDKRDQWPVNTNCYIKGDILSSGDFGTVKVADCRDPVFGFSGNETRRCVVKTVYFRRRIENLLIEKFQQRNQLLVSVDEKIYRFWKRTIMDIYVLTRCRHENLMHAHALFVADDDLHIVIPRCYNLRTLIDMYRVRHDSEPCPVAVIARIIRQLCVGLDFLNSAGIAH